MEEVAIILLPGIIMPAGLRYAALKGEFDGRVKAITKELEVYAGALPAPDYSIGSEVEGISRFADSEGLSTFHLYGHSAGGACALAFTAAFPSRVLSLAIDEPASDFSAEGRVSMQAELDKVARLPEAERMRGFLAMQLAAGVEPPPPPPGPEPEWMRFRPGGIKAFTSAMQKYRLPSPGLGGFKGPVYFSHGSLSHPNWLEMRDRLKGTFADFRSEEYVGLHHLATSHQREPRRVAQALYRLWGLGA